MTQLQVKEAKQAELEKRIHEIKIVQNRRRHREQQEMARHKAQLERDRQVARMRGPEGERARQGHHQPGGMRPQFRAPILQTVRHNSPQLSPIHAPRPVSNRFFNT